MAEKVAKAGVRKESGYLYFVDKSGDVSRARMARGRKGRAGKPEKVARVGVRKEKGYLYFVDGKGDVSRAKMARGGRKAKSKSKTKRTKSSKRRR